jgi:hypothetical protein
LIRARNALSQPAEYAISDGYCPRHYVIAISGLAIGLDDRKPFNAQ